MTSGPVARLCVRPGPTPQFTYAWYRTGSTCMPLPQHVRVRWSCRPIQRRRCAVHGQQFKAACHQLTARVLCRSDWPVTASRRRRLQVPLVDRRQQRRQRRRVSARGVGPRRAGGWRQARPPSGARRPVVPVHPKTCAAVVQLSSKHQPGSWHHQAMLVAVHHNETVSSRAHRCCQDQRNCSATRRIEKLTSTVSTCKRQLHKLLHDTPNIRSL